MPVPSFSPVTGYSPVAQQVERVAVNHLVGGSSPSRGARKHEGLAVLASPLFFARDDQDAGLIAG